MDEANVARDFYVRFAADPRADRARVIEVQALIDARHAADAAASDRLRELVAATRGDVRISREIRAELTALHEFTEAVAKDRDRSTRLRGIEEVARRLCVEFPDQPQGYESLLSVAKESDDDKYLAILRELKDRPGSREVARRAQLLLDRSALVGTALDAVLRAAGADGLAGRTPRDRPIIIYSWSIRDSASIQLARLLASSVGDRATLIGVNVDSDSNDARHFAQEQRLPGDHHFDPRGQGGEVSTALRFGDGLAALATDRNGVIAHTRVQFDPVGSLARLGL